MPSMKLTILFLKSQMIVILRIDPAIVDLTKMAIFENEFQLLPSQRLKV